MVISAPSVNAVSEMAMVPDSECKIPTLMVFWAKEDPAKPVMANRLAAVNCFRTNLRFIFKLLSQSLVGCAGSRAA